MIYSHQEMHIKSANISTASANNKGQLITRSLTNNNPSRSSGKSGPKDQVALHYYYTSPSHWCTTHEVSKL